MWLGCPECSLLVMSEAGVLVPWSYNLSTALPRFSLSLRCWGSVVAVDVLFGFKPHICQASHHCGLYSSKVDRAINCFSLLAACIVPSNTKRASPRGIGFQDNSSSAPPSSVSEMYYQECFYSQLTPYLIF